jgi:hypothetical protein
VYYSEIYFFIEGSDDERFINTIIIPILNEKYTCLLYKYANMTIQKRKGFLDSVNAMDFADYFFLGDINNSPCVTEKKEFLKNICQLRIDENKIIIVIKEIESWYLAGLDENKCRELGIKYLRSTDDITKEHFNDIQPEKFDSRIDFMSEVLKRFSIETAKSKNISFKYFMEKLQAKF